MRKPTQIVVDTDADVPTMYALCDDGTIWMYHYYAFQDAEHTWVSKGWHRWEQIPQDEEVPK